MGLIRLILILYFLISQAFAVTTAKIRRGNTDIPIDLSHPSAKSQIQDYDVIFLEEGVYSTLGDSNAKYVRFRGQGPKKTFISSSDKKSSPILVDSTEFWDLTIADARFKLSDLNGLWAVNVEFSGSILVMQSAPGKSPAFAIRSVFSEITNSDVPTNSNTSYAHFLTKYGESYLMPLQGDHKKMIENKTAANILAYEDDFDKTKDVHLKDRMRYKGLFARGLNYLYQKEILKPKYNQAKYNKLTKFARETKADGHIYVSMLYWAEADRLSGHARFDEVLKEMSPLVRSLNQECGCTIEGQGLASTIKSEIEQKLYTKLPITALPGPCKIQTLHVDLPAGGNKEELIAAARSKNEVDQMVAYQKSEENFQKSIMARTNPSEDEFLMGSVAPAKAAKDYTAVADVEMSGVKKSFTSDKDKSIDQNIVDPIVKMIKEKFASNIQAAKAKIASSSAVAKLDGLITYALYGDEPGRQKAYDELMEQQLGRKVSSSGAIGSVFAY